METKKNRFITIFFLECIRILRPLLGPDGMCIFTPYTCTLYATDQLQNKPIHKALLSIFWRLLCCNPVNGFLKSFRPTGPCSLSTHPRVSHNLLNK